MSASGNSRKIKIKCEDNYVNVFANDGVLKKTFLKDLKEYFSTNGTLTCCIDGGVHLLNADEDNIYLFEDIDEYQFMEKKEGGNSSLPKLGKKRRMRFEEIMEDIRQEKNDGKPGKTKESNEKILNKKQENQINIEEKPSKKQKCNKARSPAEKSFSKRVISIGWKHRNDDKSSYRYMGGMIGPKLKITLNGNEDYSLPSLKDVILKEYINENYKFYFDGSNIDLGTFSGMIINDFVHENIEYNFWEYVTVRNLRQNNHFLNLYLYTTKIAALTTDEMQNLPSCSSITLDNRLLIQEKEENCKKICDSVDEKSEWKSKILKMSTDNNVNIKSVRHNVNVSLADEKFAVPTMIKGKTNIKTIGVHEIDSNVSKLELEKSVPSPEYSQLTKFISTSLYPPSSIKIRDSDLQVSIPFVKETDIQFGKTVLGEGAQGVVRKEKYLECTVAIKTIPKGKSDKLVFREIALMDKIRHRNIISIMAACSTFSQIHIVMEYFPSNTLFDAIFEPKIKENYILTENNNNKIAKQLCSALTYLHLQKVPIIHRDIKTNNVLINNRYEIKLCDLGLSKSKALNELLQSTKKTIRGTYVFMAPEIVIHKEEATTESDVWSFACVMSELYNKEFVWDTSNCFTAWDCAMNNLLDKKVPKLDKVPLFLKDILIRCFNYNPSKRPKMKEILGLFKSQDVESVI